MTSAAAHAASASIAHTWTGGPSTFPVNGLSMLTAKCLSSMVATVLSGFGHLSIGSLLAGDLARCVARRQYPRRMWFHFTRDYDYRATDTPSRVVAYKAGATEFVNRECAFEAQEAKAGHVAFKPDNVVRINAAGRKVLA